MKKCMMIVSGYKKASADMIRVLLVTLSAILVMSFTVLPVLAASERESNDSAKNATAISVNTDVTGSVSKSSDVDWYKFELPKDGYVTVDLKHEILSSTSGHWNIYVYQADGVTGICDKDVRWEIAGNANGATSQIGMKAGVYYVEVTRGTYYNSSVQYTLNVNYTETEFTELEPNSTSKKATHIETNKSYAGSIASASDVDWYRFELPKDGYVTVDFKHEILSSTSGYWNIYVYQADGVTGVCDNDIRWEISGKANGATSQIGLSAGVYYVEVTRGTYYNSSAPYTINVNYTETEFTELEPNSTSKKATHIETNKSYAGSIASASDVDWYRFELPKDGYVVVDFKHEILSSTSGHWNIYVYQADGVTGVCDKDIRWEISGKANGATSQLGLSAGVYYVEVTRGTYYDSSVPYTINVNYTETEFTELEPNSTSKTATPINPNREYHGSIFGSADADWYTFTLKSESAVTLNFSHEILSSSSSHWTLCLYGADGVTVMQEYEVGGNQNGSFEVGNMKAGTYLIAVTAGRFYSSDVPYILNVSEKHDCNGDYVITKEPTCTEKGEKSKLCTVCGKVLDVQSVDATGHRSDNWTVDIEPTCNSTGKRHAVCSVCNQNVSEDTPKLEHVFDSWKTTKEPTCKVAGSEERTCSLCNGTEQRAIDKLEHRFGDWEVVSGNVVIPPIVKEQECELCGYTETVKDFGYVWVTVLAVIAVIGLGVGVVSYFKAFRRP